MEKPIYQKSKKNPVFIKVFRSLTLIYKPFRTQRTGINLKSVKSTQIRRFAIPKKILIVFAILPLVILDPQQRYLPKKKLLKTKMAMMFEFTKIACRRNF